MPLRAFNAKLTDEARQSIGAAFDAVSAYHTQMAAASDTVVTKFVDAARVLGWPDQIITGISTQIRSLTKMQMQMSDHIMDAWQEQINSTAPMANVPSAMLSKLQSWPGLFAPGNWPNAEAFSKMSPDPVQFWTHLGEQWQKNWAQMVTQWMGAMAPSPPPRGDRN